MKQIVFSLAMILFFSAGLIAQTPEAKEENPNSPEITFDKLIHDYGTIYKNGDGNCEFVFTNTGKEPLVLTNVKSSCGCTVPKWPRQPILPGKTEIVKVKYATNRMGKINKTITVHSNAKNTPITLRIVGNVAAAPKETMPEKTVDQNSTPISK